MGAAFHSYGQSSPLPNTALLRCHRNNYTDVILDKIPIITAPNTKS